MRFISLLLISRAQGVSGKNEQPTQTRDRTVQDFSGPDRP